MSGWYVDAADFYPGETVPETVDVYGKGELVEQAVRAPGGKIWHRVRFGLTDPNDPCSMVVYWWLTYCGRRLPAYLDRPWQFAEIVEKRDRCRCCRWEKR